MTSYLGIDADWSLLQLELYNETRTRTLIVIRLFSSIVQHFGVIAQILLLK